MHHNNRSAQKLIIGLGNPGLQYMQTRHNIGFMVLDALLSRYTTRMTKKDKYELYHLQNQETSCYFLKPLTYMNLSGEILPTIWKKTGSNISHTLVICDNLDLAVGQVRYKEKGSSAGQKGLQNIINISGTQEFSRIFIGIGRPTHPEQSIANYVLSHFNHQELTTITELYPLIEKVIFNWVDNKQEAIYEALSLHAKNLS